MSEPPHKRPSWLTVVSVIGILWVALSGLCTFSFVLPGLNGSDPYTRGMMPLILVFGAVCILPGFLMFFAGRRK